MVQALLDATLRPEYMTDIHEEYAELRKVWCLLFLPVFVRAVHPSTSTFKRQHACVFVFLAFYN